MRLSEGVPRDWLARRGHVLEIYHQNVLYCLVGEEFGVGVP